MSQRLWRIALVPVFVLLFGIALGAALSVGVPQAAHAQAGTGIIRVATSGTDDPTCGGPTTPCETIQYAVGLASDGDEIRVAAGRYAGTQQVAVPRAAVVPTFTQVVIITKSLTLRGGYTTADWDTSVPAQNVTIVDAEGSGRGITILGDGTQTVTVEGFTITGGDYTGLGNTYSAGQCPRTDGACGGGLYAYDVTAVVRGCVISGNISSLSDKNNDGGGVFLWETATGSRIEDTNFVGNRSLGGEGNGGGATVWAADIVASHCTFHRNQASGGGGALHVRVDDSAIVEASEFISNHVDLTGSGQGGALNLNAGSFVVRGNTFISNSAKGGGAVGANRAGTVTATLDGNVIVRNTASEHGGGVYFWEVEAYTLTNNIIAQNGGYWGGGVLIRGTSSGALIHNTIAGNRLGSGGEGVWVIVDGAVVSLQDNIITSQAFGIRTQAVVTVTADHTLFFDNDMDTAAADPSVITSTNEITGLAPAYVDPAGLDYHLACGSPAIDAGIDAGVLVDIDGDLRPEGAGFDVGADEVMTAATCGRVYLPLVLR